MKTARESPESSDAIYNILLSSWSVEEVVANSDESSTPGAVRCSRINWHMLLFHHLLGMKYSAPVPLSTLVLQRLRRRSGVSIFQIDHFALYSICDTSIVDCVELTLSTLLVCMTLAFFLMIKSYKTTPAIVGMVLFRPNNSFNTLHWDIY